MDGEIWGAMSTDSTDATPLPDDLEDRLVEFTELLAATFSTTARQDELAQRANEQAALRRVATLVARGVAPAELFAAVVREVAQHLDVSAAHMGRYDADGTVTAVSSWSRDGTDLPLGTSSPLDVTSVSGLVFTTGRPARKDSYDDASPHTAAVTRAVGIRSSVAAPIVVDGKLWGVMIASSNEDAPLARDTEGRIAAFTELVATAISNSEARTETARLAKEQAALRRVATLVAHAVPPSELFAAVAEEVGTLLDADLSGMIRFEADDTVTPVATWAASGDHPDVPDRWPTEEGDPATLIAQTRAPARIDDWSRVPGPLAAFARDELGIRSSVGSPILVEGRLWGALAVHSRQARPLPATTESRLLNFTDLVGTAVANAQARSELAASRARIVAATDEERRRVVRDLHDGAQQRLVHTIITLQLANQALEPDPVGASELMGEALAHAQHANVELRELAHGILPSVLTQGGLRAAVEALASRTPVPVEVSVSVDRLPAPVEATAYFVAAEALTNLAKHANATGATVRAHIEDGTLQLRVRDDGVGGARSEGSGLVGLADRLAALDGRLRVDSPADGGTLVAADIPLAGQPQRAAP